MKNDDTPLIPDAAWLEERLGEGSLWRPDEAALPAELTHAGSREFLLAVGFPAVRLDNVGVDTRHLRAEDGMEPFDADEIYGERCPDNDSPPTNFCFTVATRYDQHLMLDAADGGITHYDPNGWDHGAGWKGPAADDLPTLAVLLGLIAESGEALGSTDDAVRAAAVTDLRERMIDRESYTDDSAFWDEVFEALDR
ncbi:SUKH-4 family immunity protein [Streptomyces goshikiensis]